MPEQGEEKETPEGEQEQPTRIGCKCRSVGIDMGYAHTVQRSRRLCSDSQYQWRESSPMAKVPERRTACWSIITAPRSA